MTDEKIIITEEKLIELLAKRYDKGTIDLYYQKFLDDNLIFPNQDSCIKFFMTLVQGFDHELFCKTPIDPLDFFGIENFKGESEYFKYSELLKRTRNELLECIDNGIHIPSGVISDFYARYAHAMFAIGNHLMALDLCQEALKYDQDNSLSLFIKACIIEYCYINKNNDIYKIALTNYQKSLIDKCDSCKTWIDKRIFDSVHGVIDMKMKDFGVLAQCMKLTIAADTYEKTKEIDSSWTEEKDFYLRNNLFLNPLNIFDLFLSAQNEEFDELLLDESSKQYFSEIVEDYKMCRKNLFEYHQDPRIDNRAMAMVYSYTYTIFDKIAFLISKVYDLNVGKVFYFKKNFFEYKLKSNNVDLGEIKNDNIVPLYLLASDVNDPQDENNEKNVISIESLKLRLTRNQIEHHSLVFVDSEVLKRNALILLKIARNAILHTFMLIHSCPIDKSKDKITTIGTTYYQAILNIVQEGKHKDLIKQS